MTVAKDNLKKNQQERKAVEKENKSEKTKENKSEKINK